MMSVTRCTLATISSIVEPASCTSFEPVSTLSTLVPIRLLISLAASAERWASERTSEATTAKPRPCSPARAACRPRRSAPGCWSGTRCRRSFSPMMSAIFLDDGVDLLHRGDDLRHHGTAAARHLRGRAGELVGLGGGVGALAHVAGAATASWPRSAAGCWRSVRCASSGPGCRWRSRSRRSTPRAGARTDRADRPGASPSCSVLRARRADTVVAAGPTGADVGAQVALAHRDGVARWNSTIMRRTRIMPVANT